MKHALRMLPRSTFCFFVKQTDRHFFDKAWLPTRVSRRSKQHVGSFVMAHHAPALFFLVNSPVDNRANGMFFEKPNIIK